MSTSDSKVDGRRSHLTGGFKVDFPLSTVTKSAVRFKKLTVHQKVGEHDTATIRISSRHLDWYNKLNTGTPVQIAYWSSNNRTDKGSFFGYVTHVRLISNDENKYDREIVCVAASRVLRKTDQKTYINKTASEIVIEIGKDLGFKVFAKQSNLRRSTVTHSGETYWEFINKLAKRSGYILRVEGTSLFFMPLSDYAKVFLTRAPVLSDYTYDINNEYKIPTVEKVDTWVGDASDDEDRLSDTAIYASVSPRSGEVDYVRKKPTSSLYRGRESKSEFIRYMGDGTAAHSRQDAELLAAGAAENGLMAIEAGIIAGGNPLVVPYRPVFLSLRDRALGGYWLTKEVTHTFVRSLSTKYSCDIVVGTDSVTGLKSFVNVQQPGVRNYTEEFTSGFSVNEASKTRLRTVRSGFEVDTTRNGNVTGKWVHS